MAKLVKRTAVVLFTCLMAICAFFGIYIAKNDTQKAMAETTATETSVSGVQLRADVGSSQYYLVLAASEYASVTAGTAVSNPADYADLLSNITFYTSAEDTEGKSATELCNNDRWVINQWSSGGLMISMSADNYEAYSGSSVYKIVVNAGAIMPYTSTQDLKVKRTTTFTNDNYGNADVKYGSFNWTASAANEYINTSVTAFGDPDVANRVVDTMWFTLSNHDYTEFNIPVENPQVSALNTGSKIKITIDGTTTSLADNNYYLAYLYRFARANNPITLHSNISDYTTIDSITVEAGCEFPSQETASASAGFTIYRTTEDVTFVNDGTGAFLTVEAARANAKTELASYKNAADYREAQQTELAAILAEANADIDTKDSISGMSEVVAAAKSKIDALKTDAQYTAEELAQAKDSAKAELATYKSIDDYRDAEKTAITTILANATTAIDSAANKAAVETVVTEAKSALDALKTDAQYTAEEAAALATAKDSAKTELATYKNADDYREAEKTALASILATANTTIDACENAEAVGVVVAEAKAAIDELKTAAEYEAEEAPDAGDDEPTGTPDASSKEDESTETPDASSKEDESTETPDDSTDGGENEGGCGSSVNGLWAALIVAMLFVGVAVLKKKREN